MSPHAHSRPYPRVLRTLTGVGQPPHVLHPMAGFGAVPIMHLNLNPAFVDCIKSVANGGQGGKWVGDQVSGSCQVGGGGAGGIPTWAYIAGGVVVVGGAAWFFLGRD